MTDNGDRSDIYAAMAEMEEEEAAERSKANPFAQYRQQAKDRSVTVRVGEGTAEVATTAYVRELERLVRDQARKIEKFERQFHRIAASMKNQRSQLHGQNNRINDVVRDLDQKIDRRD